MEGHDTESTGTYKHHVEIDPAVYMCIWLLRQNQVCRPHLQEPKTLFRTLRTMQDFADYAQSFALRPKAATLQP